MIRTSWVFSRITRLLNDAVKTRSSDCVQYRINQGDKVDQMVNGTSGLYLAVRLGYLEIVEVLFENDADLEVKSEIDCLECTRSGDTPLHEAVIMFENEIVEFLLDNRANLTATNSDYNYRQPIHEAVINFNYVLVKAIEVYSSGANYMTEYVWLELHTYECWSYRNAP